MLAMNPFPEILDNYIKYKNDVNRRARYVGNEKYFGASSANSCFRKQYYKYNQYEETNFTTDEAYRNMNLGTIFHDDMEKAIAHNSDGITSIDVEMELVVEELLVRGFADAVLETEDGKIFLYDFKTANAFSYTCLFGKRKGNIKKYRKKSYDLQLASYGMAVEKLYGRLDGMFLVFYNKDTGDMNSYEVAKQTYINRAREYWLRLKESIDKGLPKIDMKDSPREKWECKYCNWADQCEIDEKAGK
jgi:hypothetical protein